MDHNERNIIPLNLFMIALTALSWAIFLPLWSTLIIALPICLALSWFARDRYGGMQVVMVVAPGLFFGTLVLAEKYQDAKNSASEVSFGQLIWEFVAAALMVPLAISAFFAAIVGIIFLLEWFQRRRAGIATSSRTEENETPPQE
ncbi:MAG: hypothetical protein CMJ46_09370 [Planctomyces sp.]|nr:hypothetical protein [Planctomyces sp.]